jgi:Leucine-rich repeat (LRR) protein
MSELALKLITEAKETRATRLDLGNCGLTELPDELFELTWLEELNLSSGYRFIDDQLDSILIEITNENELTSLPSGLGKLKKLRLLSLSWLAISDFTIIANLNSLEKLYLLKCKLTNINFIKNLLKLQILDVSGTQLRDLSPLKELIQLQQLRIFNTQVDNLSPLKNLKALQHLSISSTQVSDLNPLKDLKQLQNLSISSTQVSDLNPLKDLVKLNYLSASSNKIIDLSPLENLIMLSELYIYSNPISDLSPLKGLVNLQELHLNHTQINDLTPLKNLKKIRRLHVQYTYISDLNPIRNLLNLENISITSTKVSDLSPLKDLRKLTKFYYNGSPITNPPREIVKAGLGTMRRYWKEQERIGKKKVNEARLLLVGQGASGKTTLKDKLKDSNATMPEHDATTLGIDIERIICKNREGDDFTVQVWDFGGQEIQKHAHQFFMSDSVVYAVLSNTREQNPNFQYWLNIIELLGKNSPFFIVQNEKDGHAESLKDITQIQERFPHTFKSVEQVNLKNAAKDPRFEMLKQRLFYAATQLPHTQKEYLVSFINVREQLEILSKTQQTITFKEFRQLCKAEGIEDTELMNDYARTFTLLGIALHFADDVHLKAQVFLRPKWIIDALFAVLYNKKVEDQNGKFSATDAETIWHEEEYEDMHGVLLQLMVKFHLCYEIPNTKDYIVPQRLPTRLEAFVPPTDATHIVYRYRFLPSGILTQLTCRLHQRIEDDKVWNDAVQFSTKNRQGHVFVRENSAENHLELFGFGSQKSDLINVVVDTIDEIHLNSKFGNLKVEKLVPCPCPVCATKRAKQEDAGFFKYDLLIQDLQSGETESDRCEFSRKRFQIKEILKNASIHVFKIEQIRKLLERDKTEEALNILRGALSEDDEVIIQLSRLSHLKRGDRMGQLSFDEANRERNKIIKGVLEKLKEWETGL